MEDAEPPDAPASLAALPPDVLEKITEHVVLPTATVYTIVGVRSTDRPTIRGTEIILPATPTAPAAPAAPAATVQALLPFTVNQPGTRLVVPAADYVVFRGISAGTPHGHNGLRSMPIVVLEPLVPLDGEPPGLPGTLWCRLLPEGATEVRGRLCLARLSKRLSLVTGPMSARGQIPAVFSNLEAEALGLNVDMSAAITWSVRTGMVLPLRWLDQAQTWPRIQHPTRHMWERQALREELQRVLRPLRHETVRVSPTTFRFNVEVEEKRNECHDLRGSGRPELCRQMLLLLRSQGLPNRPGARFAHDPNDPVAVDELILRARDRLQGAERDASSGGFFDAQDTTGKATGQARRLYGGPSRGPQVYG